MVSSYKSPVYAVDLGSRVYDCSGVNIFHSKWEDDEFHFNVQGILSLRSAMNCNGDFLCRSSCPV